MWVRSECAGSTLGGHRPASIVSTSDGDAILEPGESAQLAVPVTNAGDFLATGVSVTLTPGVAGASVTPRSRTIGKVSVGQSRSATITVAIPPTWELGRRVELGAQVAFVGTLSEATGVGSVPVGGLAAEVVFQVCRTGSADPGRRYRRCQRDNPGLGSRSCRRFGRLRRRDAVHDR